MNHYEELHTLSAESKNKTHKTDYMISQLLCANPEAILTWTVDSQWPQFKKRSLETVKILKKEKD